MADPKTYTQEELDAQLANVRDGLMGEVKTERQKRLEAERRLGEQDTRLAALESAAATAKAEQDRIALEGKGEYQTALQREKDEYNRKLAEINAKLAERDVAITAMRVDDEIRKHAGDAIDPEDVLALMKGAYKFEVTDTSVTVKKSDGTPLLGADGKEVDVAGAVQQFLGSKPHLVKAGGTGGAGSTGSGRTPGTGTLDAQIETAVKDEDRHKVIMLKAQKQSQMGPHSLVGAGKRQSATGA